LPLADGEKDFDEAVRRWGDHHAFAKVGMADADARFQICGGGGHEMRCW